MRVCLKKMLVFCVKTSSFSLSFDRSTSIGPTWRHETEKFEGSSLRPKGWPQPPLRACEIWQTTFGTCGSAKSLTQTLSLGDRRLKVVLMQPRSSACAVPPSEHRKRTANASKSLMGHLLFDSRRSAHRAPWLDPCKAIRQSRYRFAGNRRLCIGGAPQDVWRRHRRNNRRD